MFYLKSSKLVLDVAFLFGVSQTYQHQGSASAKDYTLSSPGLLRASLTKGP